MKRRNFLSRILTIALVVTWLSPAVAVDLESFEFNDFNGTSLSGAANTANPGNQWVEAMQMFPSDVRNGSYNIVKESNTLVSNYLQIDNLTSGTHYLVARISGWKFGSSLDTANLEEVRFGFLNDDGVNFGSTVTAQMQIQRNSDGSIELIGNALGVGSSVISGSATFADTRSTPLTLALEVNKTANTYRVLYKDNTNPTQVLGLGTIAPTRDGNSIRFAVNNSFGEGNIDYPFVPANEVFSIDRIALTDTNPFNDLITLEIDRVSGSLTLRNTSGTALTGLESYSISSNAGPFDASKWRTVTGNYDSTGNGSVDNAPWTVTSSSKTLLSEMFLSGDGGGLTNGQDVVLSVPGGGTWLRSPFEDATMQLNFAGGITRTVSVDFVGNGGVPWKVGDLNFDGEITAADYLLLTQHAETSLAGLTRVEAYQRGDLDGDGVNSILDFLQFKSIYEAANGGAGSFALMLASLNVPEPASATLCLMAAVLWFGPRRRHRNTTIAASDAQIVNNPTCESAMPRTMNLMRFLLLLSVALLPAVAARAAILEDFQFNEPNGTALNEVENLANPGNIWIVGANTVESAVFDGAFRINKQSVTTQAGNTLDIANITTGKAWLVVDIAGWSYTETASSPSERVRFAFLDNDMPDAGSSTVTAEANIDRSGSGLALRGEALGGGQNLPTGYSLPLVRTDPFTIALELDKDLNQYSIFYKDNTDPFQLLGTGNLGDKVSNPGVKRDGNSVRFAFTGTFGDTGEFFDVSRIYLTDTSPLGGPVTPIALTLEVKSNGMVSILNETNSPISFDTYRISSPTGALNFGGWNSLSNQGIDPVNGGDDPGEIWTVAAGSSDNVLAESFLLGQSTIAQDDSLTLGSAFKVGGDQNLTFQYRDTVTGSLVVGNINYVTVAGLPGDYNNDGKVDAADYTVWRNHLGEADETNINNNGNGGNISLDDYTWWKQHYGTSNPGSGGLSLSAVPEPSTLVIALLLSLTQVTRRRSAR